MHRGEALGIIGKNGAGKSTLLKILSRTTLPTIGEFKVKGRIASLLEVGTGFHPELTGRDNIFLNGAILGMTKNEIRRKFDEIVVFSGVERYIDTPVKRYSSGMYVRLAFAVAAHLEPEILIIDEVLAVGDAEFQKKCLGKMKDVSGEGRTVLFVSHNMTAVKTLCSKAIYLANGEMHYMGDTQEAISQYMGNNPLSTGLSRHFIGTDFNNSKFELHSIEIVSTNENPGIITMADEFSIRIQLLKKDAAYKLDITCQITDSEGNILLVCGSGNFSEHDTTNKSGTLTFICNMPSGLYNQGEFGLNVMFIEDKKNTIEHILGILNFNILPANTQIGAWMGKNKGFFRLGGDRWQIEQA